MDIRGENTGHGNTYKICLGEIHTSIICYVLHKCLVNGSGGPPGEAGPSLLALYKFFIV